MGGTIPGFDDWLQQVLGEQAANAGQDVDSYVATAVLTRIATDLRAGEDPRYHRVAQLLGASGESGLGPTRSVLADPDRLKALHDTGLLDSPPEKAFDRLVSLAAEALAVPSAAMTLVDSDRRFVKSGIGIPAEMAERPAARSDPSVCEYAVAAGQPLVVEDTRADPRFQGDTAVQGGFVVAYLGIPLVTASGQAIGTLCAWDSEPRQWSTGHVQTLQDVAQLVMDRISSTAASEDTAPG